MVNVVMGKKPKAFSPPVTMADTVSIYPDVTNSTSSLSINSGSHCWEPDGSFHVVCIFVIAVSILCGLVTIVSVYRIFQMVMAAIR